MKNAASRFLVVVVVGGFLAVLLLRLTQGTLSLSISTLFRILSGNGSNSQNLLLFDFRLPRIVLACLAGATLGVSGTILQSITENPLADTSILGINGGAGLAALVFFSFIETTAVSVFLLPLFAFLGGLLASGLILFFSFDRKKGIEPIRMIVTGAVISGGIYGLTLFLASQIDTETYQFVTLWQAGSISNSSWNHVFALVLWPSLLFPFIMKQHKVLDILPLGEEMAISLGIKVGKERIILLIFAIALGSAAIAVTAGRLLPGTGQLPAGTVIAILGAPYFIYLLVKAKK